MLNVQVTKFAFLIFLVLAMATGCVRYEGIQNPDGYGLDSTGLNSQDITAMCDQMVASILTHPAIMGRERPARIIIDDQYIRNNSYSRVDIKMLTNRMRAALNNAARGQLIFLDREFGGMYEHEQSMKETGAVDGGSQTPGVAYGADYRLTGDISGMLDAGRRTGVMTEYNQINLRLVDLATRTIVWEDLYEVRKAAGDDVIYR